MTAAVVSLEPFISARQQAEVRRHVETFVEYVVAMRAGKVITIEDIEKWFSCRPSILPDVVVECCVACNDLEAHYGIVDRVLLPLRLLDQDIQCRAFRAPGVIKCLNRTARQS
jgi:hypothetical protein